MNRSQSFYLIRKWSDEAGKANNLLAETAGPETCAETYQATTLGPAYNELGYYDHSAPTGNRLIFSQKKKHFWLISIFRKFAKTTPLLRAHFYEIN